MVQTKHLIVLLAAALFAQSCASSQIRESRKKRDATNARFGMFCDFVKADSSQETEVEVNVRMGDRCDTERPFSITGFTNAYDQRGIMFCCSMDPEKSRARRAAIQNPAGSGPTTGSTGLGTGAGAPATPAAPKN